MQDDEFARVAVHNSLERLCAKDVVRRAAAAVARLTNVVVVVVVVERRVDGGRRAGRLRAQRIRRRGR